MQNSQFSVWPSHHGLQPCQLPPEGWDSSGYPEGLKGQVILLAARIFAVVDVWDALRNPRPYREAWPAREIEHFLEAESGRLFDPQVVRTFLQKVAR